jgi:tRNA nucleotidyltransferase (CCA-adding enzyme)
MQIYLVGGAVRDSLLGLTPKEFDWVVVGATPEEMLERGYKQVGKDFPVFLHPETGDEYALARTERKSGHGYHGFTVHASPEVTLEEDLRRRDLTINAIAQTPDGELIDPYHGRDDLEQGFLRHVSPAFGEDPVRILRVARLAARLDRWGFRVAHETHALMKQMVRNGEVDYLVPERVWSEFSRAMASDRPWRFIEVLRACGALQRLFPEIDRLFGVPQPAQHHGEIDTGVHILMVLKQAVLLSPSPVVRFAALVHDLGKGVTPEAILPSHYGHEEAGAELVRKLCGRLRCQKEYSGLAITAARLHGKVHRAAELRAGTVVDLLHDCDAFRRPERFADFLLVCTADARGRLGKEDRCYPQADFLRECYSAAAGVDTRALAAEMAEKGIDGREFGEVLRQRRSRVVAQVKKQFDWEAPCSNT